MCVDFQDLKSYIAYYYNIICGMTILIIILAWNTRETHTRI